MGKINEKNLQFRLAFNDEDLRKPAHDDIMKWLDVWVKEPENVRRFFKDFRSRTRNEFHSLDEESKQFVESSADKNSINQQFNARYTSKYSEVKKHDLPEPALTIKYKGRQWEGMLYARDESYSRKQFLGFCDMVATYNVTSETSHDTNHIMKVELDKETTYYKSWKFTEVETQVGLAERVEPKRIFFEVKTEIRSIGELLRQLQFYRSSAEVSHAYQHSGIALVVVAPPNSEARQIVESHGFGFVDFVR